MKKLFLMIVGLFSIKAMAQADFPLFDLNNQEIIGTEIVQSFSGSPVILIERGKENLPEINQAEKLPPPKLSQNPIQIPIKTPMGHQQKASFINHITDIVSFIQVLDDKNIKITEQIQFVTTDKESSFKRFFPTQKSDDIQILSVKRDQISIPFQEEIKENGKELILKNKLPKGVHRITVQYLLKNRIIHNQSLADITIPVLSGTQSDMIERLAVMIMLPKKSKYYEKEALFGSNNITIPETVEVTLDQAGNIIFQNTHPLPAYTNMKVHVLVDSLPSAPVNQIEMDTQIIIVYLGILVFYTFLSVLVCRFKKWKKPLAESKRISPVLWVAALGKKLSKNILDYLKGQKVCLYGTNTSNIFPRLASYFRFNWEYVMGVIVLIITTEITARYYDIILTAKDKGILILSGVIALIIIDIYGTRVEMNNLKEKLKDVLLNTPQGLNLASRDIQPYYIKAVCFKFNDLWEKRLIANNPSYRQLSFLRKEKIL